MGSGVTIWLCPSSIREPVLIPGLGGGRQHWPLRQPLVPLQIQTSPHLWAGQLGFGPEETPPLVEVFLLFERILVAGIHPRKVLESSRPIPLLPRSTLKGWGSSGNLCLGLSPGCSSVPEWGMEAPGLGAVGTAPPSPPLNSCQNWVWAPGRRRARHMAEKGHGAGLGTLGVLPWPPVRSPLGCAAHVHMQLGGRPRPTGDFVAALAGTLWVSLFWCARRWWKQSVSELPQRLQQRASGSCSAHGWQMRQASLPPFRPPGILQGSAPLPSQMPAQLHFIPTFEAQSRPE